MWLDRGLSEFLANTIVRRKDVLVGRVVPWHLRLLRERHLLPLSTVLAADRQSSYATQDDDAGQFNASAWALVHYLTFGENGANGPRVNRFLQIVAKDGDAAKALREVFGDQAQMETALRTYVGRQLFAYQQVVVDANVAEEDFALRTLSVAESAADRAALHAAMRRPVEARALTQVARRADAALAGPYETEGLLCEEEQKTAEASTAYSQAVERGSTNFYVHYTLAQQLWSPTADAATLGRIAQLLQRSIDLNPDFAAAYSYLADVKLDLGQIEPALPLAQRAVVLAPGESYHHATLARVLAYLSKREDALREAEKALALATNANERQRAEELITHLKRGPQ